MSDPECPSCGYPTYETTSYTNGIAQGAAMGRDAAIAKLNRLAEEADDIGRMTQPFALRFAARILADTDTIDRPKDESS